MSGGPADPDTDAVLDVVALVEARLRGDDAAYAYLLDHGDNRRHAYLLAGICAHLVATSHGPGTRGPADPHSCGRYRRRLAVPFDAGTVVARLELDPAGFDRQMGAAKRQAQEFERNPVKFKAAEIFSTADMSAARKRITDLDNQISRDATSRMRSGNGSVLGTLMALFSPRQLPGAPTAQQAASSGMLGRIFGGGGGSGAAGRTAGGAAGGVLGRVAGGIGPGILGLGAKATGILGLGGSVLGALPAAGALGAGLGVIGAGAGVLLGGKNNRWPSRSRTRWTRPSLSSAGRAAAGGPAAGCIQVPDPVPALGRP